MAVHLRPATEHDCLPLIELISLANGQRVSEEPEPHLDQPGPSQQIVAVDHHEQILGFALGASESWCRPNQLATTVVVHPNYRRQGIGSLLLNEMKVTARVHGTGQLLSRLADDRSDGIAFARQHGFEIIRHEFESALDLSTFDEEPFLPSLQRVLDNGICFTTLDELGNTPEAQRQLYELDCRLSEDEPYHSEPISFENYKRHVIGAKWFCPDGQIIALEGERWVGMAAVAYLEAKNCMYHNFTGVDRCYRGRGIAQALKLLAIRCGRGHGVATMRTRNDSLNAPMRAINEKMGYRPEAGIYTVELKL